MAWLEIDLARLSGNLAALRAMLPEGVHVDIVVKADAYGHGAVPVARALAQSGVDGLCVATLDEGLELRRAGLRTPILVLFPVPPELAPLAARRRLAVTAADREVLARTLEVMGGVAGPGRRMPRLAVHLELETGLGRGGVAPEEAPEVAKEIAAARGAQLVGVWSHLSAPADAERSALQVARFAVGGGLGPRPSRSPVQHLAASGAVLAATAPSYDRVRVGLAAYGLIPDALVGGLADRGRDLRPILSMYARPVRVADMPAGSGISYGPSFVTERPSRIATLPLGYGDGWWRTHSNRARALVRGCSVPLVGSVAMDAVMADVTDVPGPPVGIDDEFVLIGEQGGARIEAGELARHGTTIVYEVVAAMARRLPRVYHSAAGPTALRTLTGETTAWLGSNSGTATSATSRSTRS